jgi:hypothetical protein
VKPSTPSPSFSASQQCPTKALADSRATPPGSPPVNSPTILRAPAPHELTA